MMIFDENDKCEEFKTLDCGDLFRDGGEYYIRIETLESGDNAARLSDGKVFVFADDTTIENLAGEYLQVKED